MKDISKSMKPFKPTYLYVKIHNVTGLRYFGKTTHDPLQYRGSGIYWKQHIKEHGYDVTTMIIGYYLSKDECVSVATQFSKDNNIVDAVDQFNKKIWANLIIENGLDGGATLRQYKPHTEESKRKMSEARKGKIPWNIGKRGVTPGNTHPRTDEQKQKISNSLKGKKRSAESVLKTANALRGRKRPDVSKKLKGRTKSLETKEKMKLAQQQKGPLSDETKAKIREARKLQIFTEETKEKLKGKIVCINSEGQISKIDKELFYSQTGLEEDRTWVFHNSREGKKRKLKMIM